MNSLVSIFEGINDLYTKPRELAAIWLEKPLVCGSGRTVRVAPGETVRIENGKLVNIDSQAPATHKVIMCFGTLNSQFEFTLVDLQSSEPLQIKL